MAKALIAAVSLAVVLVAAVVVPLVFLPGAFGFNDWPEATPAPTHEHVVNVELPARKSVVVKRERPETAAPKAVAAPAPRQRLAQAAPAPVAPTAVGGSEQQDQPAPHPAQPSQPLAAPEVQPEPVTIDARGHVPPNVPVVPEPIEDTLGLDGTKLP